MQCRHLSIQPSSQTTIASYNGKLLREVLLLAAELPVINVVFDLPVDILIDFLVFLLGEVFS